RRWRLAALLAGLSVVTRLEGALACLLVLAAWLVLDRRKPLAVLAGVLIPGLAWVVFGWAYYGTPVFQSLVAKTAPLYPLPAGHALGRTLVELERRLGGILGNSETPEKWALSWRTGVAVLLVAAGIIGCRFGSTTEDGRRLTFACLLPAAGLVLMVAFYAVSNPLMFPWYYPALVLLLYALAAAGSAGLVGSRQPAARAAGVTAVALLLVLSAHGPAARLFSGRPVTDVAVASDPVRARVLAYRAAADWLNENLPPGTEVTASEVGSLGYYYDGPVFDCCGLVSPAAVRFQPGEADERSHPTQGVIPRRMVFELRPDVIVTMPVFARRSLYGQDWFWESYVGVEQFPLPARLWGSATVDVLVRSDLLAE
ncbi:hypothetical protein JXB37_02180, partial [candidate division WOR-3 bacterium]|nr:hypothetical protein [candidate division WOR-3 bacterium]